MIHNPKIDDEVIITIPKENREWGYNPCPDGSKGKIIKFGEIAHGRVGENTRPGIFVNDFHQYILLENGKVISVGGHCVEYVDLELNEIRLQEARKENQLGFLQKYENKYIRPLPETDYYEGDYIQIHCPILNEKPYIQPFKVAGIKYDYIGKFCDDGITEMPLYEYIFKWKESDGKIIESGSSSTNTQNSKLVCRGNVWKYHHGEPLLFDTEEDEIKFWISLSGVTVEVKNPATGNYDWKNITHFKDALYNDIVDGCKKINVLGISTFRFVDRSIGEKVRQYFLKNFKFNE